MAGILGALGMLVGGVGIFLGFYHLGTSPRISFGIVTATTVGAVGVLAFVRHFVFHRSDAERQGWQTDRPDWIFEVGFANLAFGAMGLLAGLAPWGTKAQAVALLGYALYLFQAALLHLYRYLTDGEKSASRLWRSAIATLLYVAMMTFFGVRALMA